MMQSDQRELLINVTLVVAGLLFAFGLLEVGLHLTAQQSVSSSITCQEHDSYTEFDSTLGWIPYPNLECEQTFPHTPTEQRTVTVTTDEQRRRDTLNTGSDTILVFGDSFTWGSEANDTNNWVHMLDERNPGTAFHNYGVGGYGTDQEYLRYQRVMNERNASEVDGVVIAYYVGNDGRDNMKFGRSPKFELVDGELELAHSPDPDSGGDQYNTGPVQNLQSFLRDNTKTYPFIAARISGLLQEVGLVSELDPQHAPPTGERLNEEIRLTQALLLNWVAENNERGIETTIVIIPAPAEVYPEPPNRYPSPKGEQYYDAQRTMIQQTFENRSNVTLVDLYPEIQTQAESGLVYHSKTGHFTPLGYETTAITVEERISETGIIRNDTVEN
jgi:lysophospholipase L1-like esterase